MEIRESTKADLAGLLAVEKEAFGEQEGAEIVDLVTNLINDPTAEPYLSLVALKDGNAVGHILFTRARIDKNEEISASILAPLAIMPALQRQGLGGRLINTGLEILSGRGVKLVFVLGHPEYYPRHGFKTAGLLGFEAPYPIPKEVAHAWMVQELSPGIIGKIKGKVLCAHEMDRPEYWRE